MEPSSPRRAIAFTFAAAAIRPSARPAAACHHPHPLAPKRRRPLTDVDGEGSGKTRKKKRRLRLYLTTSPLSRPYAIPPSYTVNRGSCKIAVWAKSKALGRHQLRKAAIMNLVRLRLAHAQQEAQEQRTAFGRPAYRSLPRALALPPRLRSSAASPLGLSNYAALDAEDGWSGAHEHEDEEGDDANDRLATYSDFNILEAGESIVDDDDGLDLDREPRPGMRTPSPLKEDGFDLAKERQRQRALSFVRFGEG
ncbi:MAG: hypothetical protein M1826_002291 [Phylliscum demangeonii]|nr:MAG: hypothetical protein M1826_002291 [Phylliscum demangeonii]